MKIGKSKNLKIFAALGILLLTVGALRFLDSSGIIALTVFLPYDNEVSHIVIKNVHENYADYDLTGSFGVTPLSSNEGPTYPPVNMLDQDACVHFVIPTSLEFSVKLNSVKLNSVRLGEQNSVITLTPIWTETGKPLEQFRGYEYTSSGTTWTSIAKFPNYLTQGQVFGYNILESEWGYIRLNYGYNDGYEFQHRKSLDTSEREVEICLKPSFMQEEQVARDTIPTTAHYREFDCPIKVGYMLVSQSFAQGSQVNIYSLKYPPNYFCASIPMIVTDAWNRSITTDSNVYKDLVDGSSHTVPVGMTETYFYVIRINNQLSLVCDPVNVSVGDSGVCPDGSQPTNGQCFIVPVRDLDKLTCIIYPGILHICTEGTWNGHICAVQGTPACAPLEYKPGVFIQGLYDVPTQTCYYYMPQQKKCPEGSLYDVDLDLCFKDANITCSDGGVYNFVTDQCERLKITENCSEGETQVGNYCVTPIIIVPGDCPEGTTLQDGKCVLPREVIEVINYTIMDEPCPPGTYKNDEGTACLKELPIEETNICVGGTIKDGTCIPYAQLANVDTPEGLVLIKGGSKLVDYLGIGLVVGGLLLLGYVIYKRRF